MQVNIFIQQKKNHTNSKQVYSFRKGCSNKPNKFYLQKLSNNSFPILPDVNELHVFAQSTIVFFRKKSRLAETS